MRKLDLQFFAEGDPAPADPTPTTGDKTFTQEEVNRIVSDRLTKEKGKINTERETAYSQKEQALNQRELKLQARETLSEKNLPGDLLEVLNYSNADDLNKSIEVLERILNQNKAQTPQNQPQGEKVPTITLPMRNTSGKGGDPIRSAMGLNSRG